MAELLYGAPAADEVRKRALELIEPLRLRPLLAIVRAGTDPDDLAYEKGIRAACAKCGVDVWTAELPAYVPEDTLVHAVHRIGRDEAVHGVIVMCPRQYDRGLIAAAIGRDKDVDGAGNEEGGHFTPCTAEAVMEILDHYGVECAGKKVTVVGRGAVTGAPIAALLSDRGAEVSVCHSRTENPDEICRRADILISTAGKAGLIGENRMHPGQVVIDVGINLTPEGKLCGDVEFATAQRIVTAVTPVPGGVGVVTPYILALHTARAAAERKKL